MTALCGDLMQLVAMGGIYDPYTVLTTPIPRRVPPWRQVCANMTVRSLFDTLSVNDLVTMTLRALEPPLKHLHKASR